MLRVLRTAFRLLEAIVSIPLRLARFLIASVLFNPRLGRFRLLVAPVLLYVALAAVLAYVVAPVRGITGQLWLSEALRYTDERSLATAIYDASGHFVGIFDPLLDSQEDFNYTGRPIELPDYVAYPDHKSLHVGHVPEHFWQCVAYQEDRHLGSLWNPFGIDFLGVLKIPYSTVERSLSAGRPRLGAGGSTLAMQLARTFFKTPPSASESAFDKLNRKLKEWWLAPVIHWELTRGGDIEPLKLWTANHFPLAQRTGGQALYGVEQTSLIVFGKPASALTIAEQYVLAAAVNQPIILLAGSERLNARRARTWQHIVATRARQCAEHLLAGDGEARAAVVDELARLAERPPDPTTPPVIAEALEALAPAAARPAHASPIRRSNVLIPATKYGVRDEMKSRFGFAWRSHVRGVRLTLDVADNLAFREKVLDALAELQRRHASRIKATYTLDLAAARADDGLTAPDVVIAAADRDGNLVRYFESNFNAAYFGSAIARDPATGRYDPAREGRFIGSVGKMLAAIAIANEGGDDVNTGYLDTAAPEVGLETCRKGSVRRLRKAGVAFACSLNGPLAWRLARTDSSELRRLVRAFQLTLPEPDTRGAKLARNMVVGQVAASPRTVHRMAGAILAALTGDGRAPVRHPSLVSEFDRTPVLADIEPGDGDVEIIADTVISPRSHTALRAFLSAPLCHPHGTLRRIADWCAERRDDMRLHFAKTGTQGTGALDPQANDTVDLWVAGGLAFTTGPAYSYVVLIGTGSASEPWARDLYAGAVTEPLLRLVFAELAGEAAKTGRTAAAP